MQSSFYLPSHLCHSILSGTPTLSCYPPTNSTQLPTFGCVTAGAIVSWLVIFLLLSIFGFVYLFLASLGNSLYLSDINKWLGAASIVVSMIVIIFSAILSYAYDVRITEFVNTGKFSPPHQRPIRARAAVFLTNRCLTLLASSREARRLSPSLYYWTGGWLPGASSTSRQACTNDHSRRSPA